MFDNKKINTVFNRLFHRFPELESCKESLTLTCQALIQSFEAGDSLFLCGNGGSFADAIHIKGELAKSFGAPRPMTNPKVLRNLQTSSLGQRLAETLEMGVPVVVLGESHSLRSAYENDRDPVLHYAQELNSFAPSNPQGVWIGISTSGTAKNVLAAATLAKAYGMRTIGFTGPDGGPLAEMVDIALKVPGECTSDIQENQLPVYHTLCLMIEAHFFG